MGNNVGDDDATDKQDAPILTTLHYLALPCTTVPYPALPCPALLSPVMSVV